MENTKESQIKQLLSSVELTNVDWQDQVDSLSAEDVGLLMYKLIEKNVTHDATQRHMMYDVLSALEEKILYTQKSMLVFQRLTDET